MESIQRFVVTMPLIPGYKTAVADYCRDPLNGISGGYMRWLSMDTVFLVRLECAFQGSVNNIANTEKMLSKLATNLWTQRNYEGKLSVVVSPQKMDDTTGRIPLTTFKLGCTPRKVMEVWRKHRHDLKGHQAAIFGRDQTDTGEVDVARASGHWSQYSFSYTGRSSGLTALTHTPGLNNDFLSPGNNASSKQQQAKRHSKTTQNVVDSAAYFQQLQLNSTQLIDGIQPMQTEDYSKTVVWRPDEDSDCCHICGNEFGFFNRKHHCRACGVIVCGSCSNMNKILPQDMVLIGAPEYVNEEVKQQIPQRICDICR
jgi:hypothetical protein